MLRRQHHVGRTEEGVWTRREDPHLRIVMALDRKVELSALRPANPVPLHRLDRLRPIDIVEFGQQPLRIDGNLQQPLPHVPPEHRVARLLVLAVLYLFVRQNRPLCGAPVHGNIRLVGQPTLIQLQKNPLRPLVVLRVRRIDLPVPVVGKAEPFDLPAEVRDVLLRDIRRMTPFTHRRPLRRQPERIPSHRMEHIEPLHPLVARKDVGRRVALGVAHMKSRARRVGEHVEHVVLRLGVVLGRLEGLVGLPERLPLRFDLFGTVLSHLPAPRFQERYTSQGAERLARMVASSIGRASIVPFN